MEKGLVLIMGDWGVLDHRVHPLARTWCLFELWVARVLCDNLSIRVLANNQMGMVTLLQILREVRFEDMIRGIDLSSAKTGRPEDQEYIMGRVQGSIDDVNMNIRQVLKEASLEVVAELLKVDRYQGSPMLQAYQGFLRCLALKPEDQTEEDQRFDAIYRRNARRFLEYSRRKRQRRD